MFTLNSFYRSDKWRALLDVLKSERVNSDGDIICEYCGKPIIKAYDCIGHHIQELTEANVNNYDISLNLDNIQLIHHSCHNKIHERFGYGGRKHVYIVYGAPCAGKREYVERIASGSDLVLDLDSIYSALSVNSRYNNNKRLSRNVFAVRDCVLEMIKTRAGKWDRAYIIGGYPYANERERMCETLNAEPIYISSTPEECLYKCKQENRGQEPYINKWFETFTE